MPPFDTCDKSPLSAFTPSQIDEMHVEYFHYAIDYYSIIAILLWHATRYNAMLIAAMLDFHF